MKTACSGYKGSVNLSCRVSEVSRWHVESCSRGKSGWNYRETEHEEGRTMQSENGGYRDTSSCRVTAGKHLVHEPIIGALIVARINACTPIRVLDNDLCEDVPVQPGCCRHQAPVMRESGVDGGALPRPTPRVHPILPRVLGTGTHQLHPEAMRSSGQPEHAHSSTTYASIMHGMCAVAIADSLCNSI